MTKQKALCVATRCTTPEQFIETFHRFCDEQSFFVATSNMRPVGLETPFSIQLADKTPVLQGLCVVLEAWTTPANHYKRPGIRLGIRRLTPQSEAIFYQLQALRTSAPQDIVSESSEAIEVPVPKAVTPAVTQPRVSPPAAIPPIPAPPKAQPAPPSVPAKLRPAAFATPASSAPAAPTPTAPAPPSPAPFTTPAPPSPAPFAAPAPPASVPPPVNASPRAVAIASALANAAATSDDQRTPGSELILPANPLMNLSDESIVGFVDCTLYEETANFFRAPDDGEDPDEPAPPPKPKTVRIEVDDAQSFRPASVIVETFPEEPTNEPTIEKRVATSTFDVVPANPLAGAGFSGVMPLPTPTGMAMQTPTPHPTITREMQAQLQMSGVLPLPAPPDYDPSRVTPVPAGELVARSAPARSVNKLVVGGAAIAVIAAVALVFAMRPDDKPSNVEVAAPEPKPVEPKPANPVEPVEPPPVVEEPKPPEVIEGDEVAAITEPDPKAPEVGDGPCSLEVNVTPAGTMVQIDGRQIGPSPLTVAGPCERRRVNLKHPRYKAEQRWVTLTEGKPGTLDVTLVRPTHSLTVTSKPPGATVMIGGRRAGTTPTKVQLMGFSGIEVRVEKWGFEPARKRVYSKRPNDSASFTLKRSLFR